MEFVQGCFDYPRAKHTYIYIYYVSKFIDQLHSARIPSFTSVGYLVILLVIKISLKLSVRSLKRTLRDKSGR